MLFLSFQLKGYQEIPNEVGSISPTERLMEFELGPFQFVNHPLVFIRLNPLGHSFTYMNPPRGVTDTRLKIQININLNCISQGTVIALVTQEFCVLETKVLQILSRLLDRVRVVANGQMH